MDARVPNHGQWYKNPIRAYTSHYLALVQERDRANKPRPRWRIRAFCPQSTTFPMPRTSIFCRITGNFSEPLYYQEANIMMRDGGFRAGRSYRRHLSIFICLVLIFVLSTTVAHAITIVVDGDRDDLWDGDGAGQTPGIITDPNEPDIVDNVD